MWTTNSKKAIYQRRGRTAMLSPIHHDDDNSKKNDGNLTHTGRSVGWQQRGLKWDPALKAGKFIKRQSWEKALCASFHQSIIWVEVLRVHIATDQQNLATIWTILHSWCFVLNCTAIKHTHPKSRRKMTGFSAKVDTQSSQIKSFSVVYADLIMIGLLFFGSTDPALSFHDYTALRVHPMYKFI